MPKVVSSVPLARFDRFNIHFPADWDVVYLPDSNQETMKKECLDADFLFVMSSHPVSADVIVSAEKLKLIQTEGVAFNAVDCAAAAQHGIPVCNNKAVNSVSVAEHTVGLMLDALRRTSYTDALIKAGKYAECQAEHQASSSFELMSQHVGLVGLGAIGKETAKRLRPFGCKVSYYDVVRPSREEEEALGVSFLEMDELLSTCTIVSIHVPVLPETTHFISKAQFDLMQQDTIFLNTSRGLTVDQEALVEAVRSGKIIAALDTLYPEPLPADDPLITLPESMYKRLIITPHIAGCTDEAFTRMLVGAIRNMNLILEGKQPLNRVDGQ